MPAIQLVAIDLDGTLLDENHHIPPENARAVHDLLAAGIEVCLASGRMHEATTRYASEIGLKSATISYNGAMVRNADERTPLLHTVLCAEAARDIVEFCINNCHHLNFYADDVVYVAQRGDWAELYVSQTGSPMKEIGSLDGLIGRTPTKLLLIDHPETTDTLLKQFQARYDGSLYITKTNPEYLEFMNIDANKGSALAFLAEQRGLAAEQVAAIGDAGNDIPMLKWAGNSFAMPHAVPRVKEAAKQIAEGGFPAAMRAILETR